MTSDGLILAYDLGTGGNKASLYNGDGVCLAETFSAYDTHYPGHGLHEQRPADWWAAVVNTTRDLLAAHPAAARNVRAIGISGHSLGLVPVDGTGNLLLDSVPIWSDSRPTAADTEAFFSSVPEDEWYLRTGNGFPPPLYTVFKLMWLRRCAPDLFARIYRVLGTKDYVNYRLTGQLATDYSYASGSGVYDLQAWGYAPGLVGAAGLRPEILPTPVAATEVIGALDADAAEALGLPRDVQVVAGGVDNACMALGARAFREGRVYNSLGSSSWIAVSSSSPLLDLNSRPYVFAHVVPDMFVSATAIFSAGTSFRWVRDMLCRDLVEQASREGRDVYDLMTEAAGQSPPGANGLLFNPNLAGGSSLDANPNMRGGYLGLDLTHTRADLIRAAMEGIGFGLRHALDALRGLVEVDETMLLAGGGSRSAVWRRMLADIYGLKLLKTTVDQQAAALGAAACAAVGTGLWADFEVVDTLHRSVDLVSPDPERQRYYEARFAAFRRAAVLLAELA